MSNPSHARLFRDISYSSLTSLHLSCDCNVDLADVMVHFKLTRCLQNLAVIYLGGDRCTSKFVSSDLAKLLRNNEHLTCLYLSCIEIAPNVIDTIHDRVSELGLIQTTIQPSLIDKLAKGASIRRLSLYYCTCSDDTLLALARLVANSVTLRELRLTGALNYGTS